MGKDPTMDTRYQIDETSDGSVYRLFVAGSQNPYLPDADLDLVRWF